VTANRAAHADARASAVLCKDRRPRAGGCGPYASGVSVKKLAATFVIAYLSGCVATAPTRPSLAAKTTYQQLGATVYSPNEQGWFLMQSNGRDVAFARQYGSKDDSAVANTTVFRVVGFESDRAFLDYIASEREKLDDKTRFKILNVSNEQVTFKGASCLKYRGVSEDHKNNGIASTDFQYLKTSGYICRHPANKAAAFQMEISHRSNDSAFPDALLSIGQEFFDNIQFSDQGPK